MKWFKRIFNRNVYVRLNLPPVPSKGEYLLGISTKGEEKIVEVVYTGLTCSSEEEVTMILFMMSKHDGKRGWRLPTLREAVFSPTHISVLSVVNHFSDWVSLRAPLELVLVRDVTEEEYNYYNGPITRFFKMFARWTY